MGLIDYSLSSTSIVLRVKIRSSTTGNGLTGLTGSTSGIIISTIADNEASPTTYTAAGATIQTIATLGTYAAPSANNCRFGEVSSANNPGIYEIQLANARYAVASSKSLLISITGASGSLDTDVVIPLQSVNPYSSTAFITGVNGNTAITANVTQINADTASPANLANTFNGTGYANATAPAQQQQVANIAVIASTTDPPATTLSNCSW